MMDNVLIASGIPYNL